MAWAASEGGGLAVSVNDVVIQGGSPRVPGCAVRVSVSGVGTGTHLVGVVVAATEPSGTATVVDVPPAAVSTGSLVTGTYDLTTLVKTLGLVPMDNGYHLRVNVTVDGTLTFSKPFWLACGRAQHAGRSVRMTFAVEWRDSAGQTSTVPPADLPSGYVLTATSNHGTATCTYANGGAQLTCDYPPTEDSEGMGALPSLQVSGLGSYVVSERGLPPGWLPDPSTVGEFAATPSLPGAGSEHEGVLVPHAPATTVHTVVNVQLATGPGYWLATADGDVYALGSAGYYGSAGGQALNAQVVGMAAMPTGGGYWEVASDGGIFAFGDAQFHGSMGGQALNAPVVGMAATPTGLGYWEAASDGGIFTFGNAQFHGSMGGQALNAPVVGMAAMPTGGGYWEVASDGGIFTFGDAQFHGSMGGQALNAPVVGVAATPDGEGYWLVASDGGVFSFGDAQFYGAMSGTALNAPVVGMAATPDGKGYWEVAADGGVFSFGEADYAGSMAGRVVDSPVVAVAA